LAYNHLKSLINITKQYDTSGESEGIVYHFDFGGARSSLDFVELNLDQSPDCGQIDQAPHVFARLAINGTTEFTGLQSPHFPGR
jgi:hypothetical protein